MFDLETKLDSFNEDERLSALNALLGQIKNGEIKMPESSKETNVHFHTFFSYNGENYSPSKIAYLARKAGLASAGTVDFDVLDAAEEFFSAAAKLNLKAIAGMETRVFVSEFADRVINSPGEPGVAYHMGTGFPTANLSDELVAKRDSFKKTAQQRNIKMIESVNAFLSPVELVFGEDVDPLTPAGNATERHICQAYADKAAKMFTDEAELAKFWSEKLGEDSSSFDLPAGAALQGLIRAKTMKRGGVGYVQPGPDSFPKMEEVNAFVKASGGIPTLAWLNGLSDGEKAIEELMDIAMASGVAAFNIIPDRNFTPGMGEKDEKCRELYKVIEVAKKRGLAIIAGTEMNSPGQKFVDDFKSKELAPLVDTFYEGAMIVYAHTVLQRQGEIGYISDWADKNFSDVFAKNAFFAEVGELLTPKTESALIGVNADVKPEDIVSKLK